MRDLAAEGDMYRRHARSPIFRTRVNEVQRLIAAHPDFAVSVSWGKDSSTLLTLAASINPIIKSINIRYPNPSERFADIDRVRDAILSRPEMARVQYAEVSCPGEWEMYERAGHGFIEAQTREQRAVVSWWKRQLDVAAAEALRIVGAKGTFLGLRKEESFARRMNIKERGLVYCKNSGANIAIPLGHWSGRDVWAWIATQRLPYLRIYDTAGVGRERARSGFVFATGCPEAIERNRVWDDWIATYPHEISAWLRQFPGLAPTARHAR